MNVPARSIVLIGMMGAGKSSVGRCLQRLTGLACFDIDELIEAEAGQTIPEIFAEKGESYFRDLESTVLGRLRPATPAIVVTGGGIVGRPDNVAHLKNLGLVVWLIASEDVLFERTSRRGQRPLLEAPDPRATLSNLLRAREPLYRDAADLKIDTTRLDHEAVADQILGEVDRRTGASA